MLTHKQAWRRQKRSHSFDRALLFDALKLDDSLRRSSSLPNMRSRIPFRHSRRHLTTGDLEEDCSNRAVKFCDNSKVVLIPSRDEYKKHGLASDIWWEPDDYNYFKASARLEVMDLLEKYGGNVQNVLTALYQPDNKNIQFLQRTSSTEENDNDSTSSSASSECSFASDSEENKGNILIKSDTIELQPSNSGNPGPLSAQFRNINSNGLGKVLRPSEICVNEPPCGIRAPRDSIRSKDKSAPTFSKHVHPLALMV